MLNILKGKLTYLMAAIAIIYGIYALSTGSISQAAGWEIIWSGLVIFGIRRAIA